jgi:hypothetical protein
MIKKIAILRLAIVLTFAWSAILASALRPQWSGWQLDISDNECELLNEFQVHPNNLMDNGGFLAGTSFEYVWLKIVTKTNARDADRYHVGAAVFGIAIRSHVDLEPADRINVVIFGGAEKTAVKWGKRPPGDKLHERYASFWFYDADAETMISRLLQGESLPLEFISRSGDRVIETEFANQRPYRFPAWEAAFRACALANRE